MEKKAFLACLRRGSKGLDIKIDRNGEDNLYRYFIELRKWSRKVNLIAKQMGDEEIIEKHLLDSLTLVPLLSGPDVHLLDIGTGAGFPGLAIKAVLPEISLTLVEPRLKRVTFLNHVVRTLGLKNVEVLACRAEDEEKLPSELGCTHITSRAVTEICGFLEMSARFAQQGGAVICMKGPKWEEELQQAESDGVLAGYRQETIVHCSLPFSGGKRTLVVFRAAEVC